MVLETSEPGHGEETVLVDGDEGKIVTAPVAGSKSNESQDASSGEYSDDGKESIEEERDENESVGPASVEEELGTDDVIEDTAENTSGETERDFDKDPTELFALIQKKEWAVAVDRAQSHREEANVWVSRKEKDGRLRWRLLPIHAAVVFKAPESVVGSLLAAYPKGAQLKDDQGMLPLHLAFRNGSSESIVNLLLVSYPQSIDIADRKGRVPLVLAQASNSPHKEAYVRALERGPAYYAVTATSTSSERATIIAEQRAIYEAKLMEVKQQHEHELAAAHIEAAEKQRMLHEKLQQVERDLTKTQETSQVLVDHVNSLEAQLNSRSDTERFLATRIATLDSSLKDTTKMREEIEAKLKHENYALTIERDALKIKFEEMERKFNETREKLIQSLDVMESREEEWTRLEVTMQKKMKTAQVDWANAQANCAILDAQLKKKMETEHALASQVSTLASKLAEASGESRDFSKKTSARIKELEDERFILRESVHDLTKRLTLTARVLDAMAKQQNNIVVEARKHDEAIGNALTAHAKIVSDAMAHDAELEKARLERAEMRRRLAEQEDEVCRSEAKRMSVMKEIAVQGENIKNTKSVRDEMLTTVKTMGDDVQSVLNNILAVIPREVDEGDNIVDIIVSNVSKSNSLEEKNSTEEKTKVEDKKEEETVNDEEAAVEDADKDQSSEETAEERPAFPAIDSPKAIENVTSMDRVMANRSDK